MQKTSKIYAIILLIIAIVSHVIWFYPDSVLTFSDWQYWPNSAVGEMWNSWGTWVPYFNFGQINIQIPFLPFVSCWSFLVNHGFTYDFAAKITFFIPIAIIGFLSPFVWGIAVFKDSFISFVVALFYGTTTYFLIRQSSHLPVAFVYACAPLLLLLLAKALEYNKFKNWFLLIVAYCICVCYEVRITLLVSLLLFIYILIVSGIKPYAKNMFISCLVFLGLNLYWMLPVIVGGSSQEISRVAFRGIFGNWLFSLPGALALFDSSWTGGYLNMSFIPQPIPWYFFAIPGLSVVAPFLSTSIDRLEKQRILFFLVILAIGIFLTKQAAPPFGGLYQWLYYHLPGFSLFREASKFYLLSAIGYAGLLGYSLKSLKAYACSKYSRFVFYSGACVVCILALINLSPLANGDLGTLFVPRTKPSDYKLVDNFIQSKGGFFRTLWVPMPSRWGFFSTPHPIVSAVAMIDLGKVYKTAADWQSDSLPSEDRIASLLSWPFFQSSCDLSSIKYVIVPLKDVANDDNFYIFFGGKIKPYKRQLEKLSWLKQVDIGAQRVSVYENMGFRPHFYTSDNVPTLQRELPYNEIASDARNPAEYHLKLKNVSSPVYVNLSEKFHPGWRLRLGAFKLTQVFKNDYFLPDRFHSRTDVDLNIFYLDLPAIKHSAPNSIKVNQDGTVDLEMTVFFYPQIWFYLGLVLSAITLFGTVLFFVFRSEV